MKKISITLFVLFTLILSACSNNDSNKGKMKSEDKSQEMKSDDMKSGDMKSDDMKSGEKKSEDMMVKNSGKMAPMFSLNNLNGDKINLADFKGKKVYIKYWASWCPICLAGLDELNSLSKQSNDFVVLSIVTPNYKGEKSSKEFMKWFKGQDYNNMTVLLDENGSISKKYGVLGFPSSFYVGSDGVLVKSMPGHNENMTIKENMMKIK